jgi:acetyl esterase/lipase
MDYFQVQVPDTRCALRWAIANAARFGWDATKLGVAGTSAGATIAADVALTGSRTLGMDGTTPLDATSCPFGTDPYRIKASNLYYGMFEFGKSLENPYITGDMTQDISLDGNISPTTYVTPTSPPAFLENGSDDQTVPPVQSQKMANVFAALNVPYLYFELQGQGHGFTPESLGGPGVQAAHWCRNVYWLHKQLGG